MKAIVDQQAGAPQDLDDAAANLKVAEADLALSRARLAKTRIVAPWAGALGPRRVSPGAFLRPGDPITELAAIAVIKVEFAAPERYVGQLKRGAEVTVSTPAYPDYELTGHIDVVDPVLDPVLRNAELIARVKNPEGRLRPGMSANVSAVLSRRDSALTIPNEAVFAEGDKNFVFAIKPDSTVTRVALALGTRLAGSVEVLEGLEPGMQVVRAGHQKLFEGAKVMPILARRRQSPAAGGAAGAPPPAGERPNEALRTLDPAPGPRDGDEPRDRALRRDLAARGSRCASTPTSTRRSSRSPPSIAAPARASSRPRSPTCSRSSSRPSKA